MTPSTAVYVVRSWQSHAFTVRRAAPWWQAAEVRTAHICVSPCALHVCCGRQGCRCCRRHSCCCCCRRQGPLHAAAPCCWLQCRLCPSDGPHGLAAPAGCWGGCCPGWGQHMRVNSRGAPGTTAACVDMCTHRHVTVTSVSLFVGTCLTWDNRGWPCMGSWLRGWAVLCPAVAAVLLHAATHAMPVHDHCCCMLLLLLVAADALQQLAVMACQMPPHTARAQHARRHCRHDTGH